MSEITPIICKTIGIILALEVTHGFVPFHPDGQLLWRMWCSLGWGHVNLQISYSMQVFLLTPFQMEI
jgi:hypothetical protein